jgi:hypothetical protein
VVVLPVAAIGPGGHQSPNPARAAHPGRDSAESAGPEEPDAEEEDEEHEEEEASEVSETASSPEETTVADETESEDEGGPWTEPAVEAPPKKRFVDIEKGATCLKCRKTQLLIHQRVPKSELGILDPEREATPKPKTGYGVLPPLKSKAADLLLRELVSAKQAIERRARKKVSTPVWRTELPYAPQERSGAALSRESRRHLDELRKVDSLPELPAGRW